MQPVNHDQRRSRADNKRCPVLSDPLAAALASLTGLAPFVVTARLMAGLDFDEAAKRAPNLRQIFDLIAKPSLVESFDREHPAIPEQPFLSPLAWAYYSAYSAIMTSAFVTARALAEGLEDAGTRLDLKTTKPFRQIDEAVLKQAPAIRLSSRRSYMGVQTMNKQSEDKIASLQDELNEINPAKDELNEQDLNKVSGGSFDIEQVLNIGSQSSGAGAGKITFNPFSITRK